MKEVLLLASGAGLVFLLFGGTLCWGLVQRQKSLVRAAGLLFAIFLGLVGWAGIRLATNSYHKLTKAVRPRTGDEIYDGLFGRRQATCVKVLNHQDQVIPKIDYAIWLRFETCPEELKRILALHSFTMQKQATTNWATQGPLAHENWFKPESLGDSVLVFSYRKDDYGNGQTIYSSCDSTQVFCLDVLD